MLAAAKEEVRYGNGAAWGVCVQKTSPFSLCEWGTMNCLSLLRVNKLPITLEPCAIHIDYWLIIDGALMKAF